MKIFNSLTRKFDTFKPLQDKKVTIYVCGITPYDTTHLGHASTYIFFDTLIRYLKFKGFQVIYTVNVTDINDRDKDILQRAKEQNIPWTDLAKFWTDKFLEDMRLLNWTSPTYFLKASGEIPSMISLIQKLLTKNLAYERGGSIYLDILKISDFGKLSRFNKNQMLKVAKKFDEDLDNPDKKHPLDITLWRATAANQSSHIPTFPSPFGPGRPGWHIECSAMSMSTLGEQIDIHGGGEDLIFPHHEAEIAQSEGATGKVPFVKFWIHTKPVFYRGKKMSKSELNLVMISRLLQKYSPNAIRWLLLSKHFTKSWEFTDNDLIKAQKNVKLIENALVSQGEALQLSEPEFSKIMDDNLNTPKALEFLLKLAKSNSGEDLKNLYGVLGFKPV